MYLGRNGRIYEGALGQLCAAIDDFKFKLEEAKPMGTTEDSKTEEEQKNIFERITDINHDFAKEVEGKLMTKFTNEVIDYGTT
jgi:hypothetical protein